MKELEQEYKLDFDKATKAANEWYGYMEFCREKYLEHKNNADRALELWAEQLEERSKVVLRVVK